MNDIRKYINVKNAETKKIKYKKDLKNLFYDGFNSKLIETSAYEGELEIPIIRKNSVIEIPKTAITFKLRKKHSSTDKYRMLVFYEFDYDFRDFISIPQNFIEEIKDFYFISTPDCSIYRDMPLWEQIANIGVSRSVGHYLQELGFYVIPNVRWGDERTYTSLHGETPIAFLGIEKGSTVSIGTLGCSNSNEDIYHMRNGIKAMLHYIEPKAVIVYGSFNHKIFDEFKSSTTFYHIRDIISECKGE